MKKILLILCLFPILVFSQKSYKIPADSTILNNIGSGKNELVIRNATSNITGGVLTNLGNGVTAFVLGGNSARVVDTIYKNSSKDSIVFTISGVRYSIRDSLGTGTVTSVATDNTLTGGTITTSGTLKVDTTVISTKGNVTGLVQIKANQTSLNDSVTTLRSLISTSNTDSQSLHLVFSDSISLSITRGNTIKFAYAIDSVGQTVNSDSMIVYKAGVRYAYVNGILLFDKNSAKDSIILTHNGQRFAVKDSIGGGGGGGGSLSSLTAATATNNIQNENYKQRWNWNTLAGDTAMVISSNSTGAASNLQNLLTIAQSGAAISQTTFGLKVSNLKTGSTNVGAYFEALNGATNYSAEFLGDIKINSYSSIRMGSTTSHIYFSSNSGVFFNSTNQGIKYNHIGYMDYFAGSTSHIFTSTKTLPFVIAATASTNYLSFAKPSTNQNSIIFNGDYEGGYYRGETTFSNTINTANGILKIAANTGQTGGYAAFTPNYVLTIKPTTCINLKPITATAASAITAAEGDMVFVSDTNGTFTSIGLWCYENGAWSKK